MCFARIDAAGQQHRRHLARLLRQLLRVLPLGDRVQIDDAVDAVVTVLQRHPVAQRAEVVAEMGDAGGLDAGEDALHGGLIADPGRRRKAGLSWRRPGEDRTMLPTPGFHHLHLNSVDPDAAIDWYTRQFPSCTKGDWAGFPALLSPNNVMVLFTKVDRAAAHRAAERDLAFRLARHRRAQEPRHLSGTRDDVELLPLYTTDEGGSVLISSDTWPNVGGVLGLTQGADRRGPRARACSRRAAAGSPTWRGRTMPWSSMPGTIRPNGSTTCISGRRSRCARCSGTRSI